MKDIKGYEGQYAVTSCGRVWSYKSQRFLSPGKIKKGYLNVSLCKDGKAKSYLIHRLVAEAYLPNPNNLPEVNHKDENPAHNWLNNLEWCDSQYNNNYGSHNTKRYRPVYCVELNKSFNSIKEAATELGLNHSHISSCCTGKRKTHGGYHWQYIEEVMPDA